MRRPALLLIVRRLLDCMCALHYSYQYTNWSLRCEGPLGTSVCSSTASASVNDLLVSTSVYFVEMGSTDTAPFGCACRAVQ